jgi:mannose-6-phosphate isomerase-like protein (cupin superfamily)
MRFVLILVLLFPLCSFGQTHNLIEYAFDEPVPDVQITHLGGDSLSSSFLINIKTEVKSHKHAFHSEHVYIVDGEGTMKLGDDQFAVRPGDHVFVPKNTFHSVRVTSTKPLKVLSIQSPLFDGKDRIWEQP